MKITAYVGKDKFPHFECWIDDALPADKKPKNNWKLFYKCVDKNDWDGPAYTENQGIAMVVIRSYYVRFDTVTKKTVVDHISVREITPPN
jgi:hypothetical protein